MADEIHYHENEQAGDFPDLFHVSRRFKTRGEIKALPQVKMYKAISRIWAVGKVVLDAGCGMGIGSNWLAQNALGVLGVDNDPKNIEVARQMFEHQTLKFEEMDLVTGPQRPMATADIVTCIEVIEHVVDYDAVINTLKQFHDPKRRTVFFISSPNRNSEKLGQDHPHNKYHVREWTAGEFYEVMTRHFRHVVVYDANKLEQFGHDETVDGDTKETPLLAKCEDPI